MLFAYDQTANADNWLHDCMVDVLRSELAKIDQGLAPTKWPDVIPPTHRPRLRRRSSVRDRMAKFLTEYSALSPDRRVDVRTAIVDQNRLGELFRNEIDCPRQCDLPKSIRKPTEALFETLFGLLTDFGLRDTQYSVIYTSLNSRVCAFCGCEFFDPPALKRHDLDHYLARSIYPFAASNLRNLAPMGDRCNKSYKGGQDMLRNDLGTRRKCSDPFVGPVASISLRDSVPFARNNGRLPRWEIALLDDCEELQTWDAVFSIRARYAKAVLDPEYSGWLDEFARWCASPLVPTQSSEPVQKLLDLYLAHCVPEGLSDRAFLRRAAFEMLRDKCDDADVGPDVVAHLRDVVSLYATGT